MKIVKAYINEIIRYKNHISQRLRAMTQGEAKTDPSMVKIIIYC
jgi:hypothetical protein